MRHVLALLVVAAVLGTAAAAVDPAARCSSAKLKAAARKATAKLRCHASANARGVAVDAACLQKAEAKFASAWARIEAAGGCRTTQDEDDIEFKVDAFVANLAVSLASCGTVDGVCGGTCPFGLNCFEIGVGCYGEPEPCRCHGSTTTCPTTSTTTTSLP